jgi:hypothetical protein
VLNPPPPGILPFSLLGLGDVAVPGLLACLMLRYDASRATDMRGRATAAAAAFMVKKHGALVLGDLYFVNGFQHINSCGVDFK